MTYGLADKERISVEILQKFCGYRKFAEILIYYVNAEIFSYSAKPLCNYCRFFSFLFFFSIKLIFLFKLTIIF
jgi:hypothetical protein